MVNADLELANDDADTSYDVSVLPEQCCQYLEQNDSECLVGSKYLSC